VCRTPRTKCSTSLLSSLFGLLFKRSFTATAARPAYVEDATSYSISGRR
jgi:hypothetical protein